MDRDISRSFSVAACTVSVFCDRERMLSVIVSTPAEACCMLLEMSRVTPVCC